MSDIDTHKLCKQYSFNIVVSNEPNITTRSQTKMFVASFYLNSVGLDPNTINTVNETWAAGRTQEEAVDRCLENIKVSLWTRCNRES